MGGARGHRMSTDNPTPQPISDTVSLPPVEPASFQLQPGDRVGNYVIREQEKPVPGNEWPTAPVAPRTTPGGRSGPNAQNQPS